MTTTTARQTRPFGLPAFGEVLRRAWQINPMLTILTVFVALSALLGMIGIAADPRTVLGMPTWNKTVKFSLSVLLYSSSLLLLLGQLTRFPRLARFFGTASGVLLLAEMVVLIVQGGRAVPMHFNVSTPLNSALWNIMTGTIGTFYTVTMIGFGMLLRERLADRVLNLALRLGFLIAVLGMGQAFLMTGPKNDQLAHLKAGDRVDFIGAHTVGADDGGPGLPFVGWSTQHGDLRIGHFIGLHGLQAIPLLALALGWVGRGRLRERTRLWLVSIGAAGYLGLVALTTWQALRGQPLLLPDALTLTALGALVALVLVSAAAVVWANQKSEI